MKNNKINNISNLIKIAVFGLTMAVMTVTGLAWFKRPDVSQIEKRKLTEFPKMSLSALADGSWFSGVETWYADTFPARERLVNANNSFKSLYGKTGEKIVGAGKDADEIPDNAGEEATLPVTTEPQTVRDGIVSDEGGETMSGVYVSGDTGYSMYYFVKENADWYAAVLNEAQKKFDGKATVYDLIIPLNSGVVLSDSLQKELGISDQREAISYIYGRMNPAVRKVPTFEILRNHCDEYIFFRTDHHWTALGAYYVYTSFCSMKGIAPHMLSQFGTKTFEGFVGTHYSETNSAKLKANPDTITAYVPMGTDKMTITDANGETNENWPIIMDVDNYPANSKYSCFVNGDAKLCVVENPQITDGSACICIKDSFGCAFVPFLVDHYQYTYWVDYRYFHQSLSAFVEEHNITDIIFLQNIYNTAYKKAIQQIQDLVES